MQLLEDHIYGNKNVRLHVTKYHAAHASHFYMLCVIYLQIGLLTTAHNCSEPIGFFLQVAKCMSYARFELCIAFSKQNWKKPLNFCTVSGV